MKGRISVLATLCLATGLVIAGMGAAAAPEKTIIEDIPGDANGINDQGTGDGSFGDIAPGADAGNVSDLLAVRLSNDAKNLYVTFQAESAPPATQGLGYRLRVNPDGTGGTYCIMISAYFPGATNDMTEFKADVWDACAGGDPVEVKITGSVLTIPRKVSKAFGKGAKLTAPQAQTFVWSGTYPTGVAGPYIDTTKVGSDYKFVDK